MKGYTVRIMALAKVCRVSLARGRSWRVKRIG